MDDPETAIALSAIDRNSGPIALICYGVPQNHIQWGVVRPPRAHSSGSLSTAGLSNSPPSLDRPHPKI